MPSIALETRSILMPAGWDLSQLLAEPREESLLLKLKDLSAQVASFARWRERLSAGMDPAEFLSALRDYEAITSQAIILDCFASLWFSEDTQSQTALTCQNRVQQAVVAVSNQTLFFELWWKALSDAEAAVLAPPSSLYPDEAHFLAELRRLKPYALDERNEQIIGLKDSDGIGALMTLYSVLTNRLEFRLEVDGTERLLTRDELSSYAHSAKPAVREAVYRELFSVYGREETPLAQIFSHRVRDWHNEHIGLRGHRSAIAVRNVSNDIPDAAIDSLLAVTEECAPIFHRYFRLKAKRLGQEKLRRYDLYAPLAEADRTIPYDDAVRLVLDTFESFHPRFAEQAQRVFAEGHIDSEVRRGKRAGAFCATVLPHLTPWVLVNFNGRLRDVTTLAHELGHAIHSMMAAEHSLLTQRSSLPLAETASVFAEMLVTERLLAEEKEPVARRELLLYSIDNIYASVVRQTYFVLFEKQAHEAVLNGCSPEELSGIYLANLRKQFGDSVEVPDEFGREWLTIPHIYHTPFYCYAYSFGQLLVLALYRRYQKEGDAFKPSYLKLLAYGGAARPERILREAGVDPTDPTFWRGGFEVIDRMIDDFEISLNGSES